MFNMFYVRLFFYIKVKKKRRDGFGVDFCKSRNKCVAPRKGYIENLCFED